MQSLMSACKRIPTDVNLSPTGSCIRAVCRPAAAAAAGTCLDWPAAAHRRGPAVGPVPAGMLCLCMVQLHVMSVAPMVAAVRLCIVSSRRN
jgi:hypothetical protein